VAGVFKIAFKFKLADLRTCNKTKRKKAIEKGKKKIEDELDIIHFIRFQVQTRSLLKQLCTTEEQKKAKDLKCYLHSNHVSEESDNPGSDPFETIKASE